MIERPAKTEGHWPKHGSIQLHLNSEVISRQRRQSPLAQPGVLLKPTYRTDSECTKIARFSAVAAAIFTAPGKIARLFEAPRCAISSAKKVASEPRFFLRSKRAKMILAAEFLAIPSSAVKIASERRCAILVHSEQIPTEMEASGSTLTQK